MPTPHCEAFPQGFPTNASGQPDAVGQTVVVPFKSGLLINADFLDKTPPPGSQDGHTGGTGRARDCYVRRAGTTFQRLIQRDPNRAQHLPIIISSRCKGCAHMVTCTLEKNPPTP